MRNRQVGRDGNAGREYSMTDKEIMGTRFIQRPLILRIARVLDRHHTGPEESVWGLYLQEADWGMVEYNVSVYIPINVSRGGAILGLDKFV